MAKVLTSEIPETEYNDLKSFIKDCSAEIHKSLKAMKEDQIFQINSRLRVDEFRI